jgi:ABC-type transporter Mla maintaining outer membrane lipid asymmetry ATPase subunit MlaF
MKRKSIQSLKLENVSFTYEDSTTTIFEDISIDLPTAKAVWIRSPGNRGKSTLLRLLAGLLTPQTGRYLINGEDVNEMSFEQFLAYRISMGYGFDYGGLMNNKTLFENLALPLQYHNLLSADEIQDRVNEVVELFGMGQAKDQRPYSVSGSQRKLTCVIRAFIHWPQVVFMDDPVTGLKADNLNDLIHYVEEGFASRGLRQMFFTGESPVLAERFKAEELLISTDWFTTRSVA